MKKTISLMIVVTVMVMAFIVPVSATEGTSPLYEIAMADFTVPVEVTSLSEIIEGESVLKNDVSGDLKITTGEYVIDLNGYTWYGRLIVEGGVVTVKDTSAEKTGKIDASLINDAVDISGGAIVNLEGITILGAFGSGDGVFVTGSPNVTINNCIIAAGKVAIDVTSLSAVVIVENTTFADFAEFVPGQQKDERNAAIEFRNNGKIILRGNNVFEINKIICRTETHDLSFAESFMLGDNVTATFEAEDTELGIFSENLYTGNKITYVYEAPADEPADEPSNDSVEEPTDEPTDDSANDSTDTPSEEGKENNPNTGDFMPAVVVVAAMALVLTFVRRKAF